MLGLLPCFVLVTNFALRPARRITTHAVAPRSCESDVEGAAAVQVTCFALPTCFAVFFRNLRPLAVAVSVPALKPPDFNVVTTLGATTFAAPEAVRVFDEPNLRPRRLSFTFTPGTRLAIFFPVALVRT